MEVVDEADAADDVAEVALHKHAAAGIAVVGLDFFGDVGERDAVFAHEFGREFDLVLCGDAAVVADVGHA